MCLAMCSLIKKEGRENEQSDHSSFSELDMLKRRSISDKHRLIFGLQIERFKMILHHLQICEVKFS
jgi:hypothetical protein